MGQIIGESFADYVDGQIKIRQKKLGAFQKDNDILTYETGKSSWIRLCSGIDVTNDKLLELGLPGGNNASFLARKYTLFGGTYNTNDSLSTKLKGGLASDYDLTVPLGKRSAYGFNSSEDFGLVPMAGIVSADITPKSQGSLREATIKVICHNINQFNIIESLYLRLKYTILLEWGHSIYFRNDGSLETNPNNGVYKEFFDPRSTSGPGDSRLKYILEAIRNERKNSNGNYDGFLGWVTNYSWSVKPNGEYEVTIKAISHGDVIESLTITTPSPNEGGSQPTNPQNPAENSILGKLLGAIKRSLDGTSWYESDLPLGAPTEELSPRNGGNPSSFKVSYFPEKLSEEKLRETAKLNVKVSNNFNEATDKAYKEVIKVTPGTGEAEYYITLGALLRLIKCFCLKYDTSQANLPSIFDIDCNYDNNQCFTYPNLFSADPKVCLVSSNAGFTFKDDGTTYKMGILNDLIGNAFIMSGGGKKNYMYMFININQITATITDNLDPEGNLSLFDFLSSLLSKTNDALAGLIALEPYYNTDDNTLYIIDRSNPGPIVNNPPPTKINVGLIKEGQGNFVKDVSITSEITPNLSTQIAIGAQASNEDVGIESVAFSRWNKGLTDRIVTNKVTPVTKEDDTTFIGLLNDTANYAKYYSTGDWGESLYNLSTTVKDYMKIKHTRYLNANPTTPPKSFIPISLNLTIDGISGPEIFQKYTITDDFLPLNYRNNVDFIVKGLTHNIDSSGWTTKIESQCMPKGNSDAESPTTETSTATGGASTTAASTSSGGGGSNVKRKGPFTKNQGRIVHTYQGIPAQNIQILINKMNAMGLTNTAAQVGILCVIGKESGFKPGKENSYAGTSSERIKNVVFKTPMKNKTLAQIEVLKKDYNAFFNHVYGGKYGNTAPNDGSRYVGRGFNQITFKGNYASYSKKVGVDLVNNPDLLENPEIAADVAIKFLTRGQVKTFNTPEEAIIYYADINAGGKKSTFGREAAFKESNKFDIV